MAGARLLVGGTVAAVLMTVAPGALAQCYVDSVGGDDGNDGLSDTTPVASQEAIPSGCSEVRYKRGSVFNEAVRIVQGVTTYTNYGDSGDLPKFVVPHTTNSGPLVSAYQGGITIDGLYLEGSKGDGTMQGLGQGVCVTIGGNSQVLNSEITNCDIGMMLHGEGSLIQGNYFHDMTMAVDAPLDSIDPNLVGGGNGIFIHGSNNEIAYNSFIRCADYAEWTESPCDGGATEITVGSGATITGVKVHHNFSYGSCGFLEIATVAGDVGRFVDSDFYYNVHVDGGWLMLLQVNNTEMSNVRFHNNTVIQRPDSYNTGMVVTVFAGFSSGTEGGTLDPGEVAMTNNLIIFDGVMSYGDVIDPAIAQTANLILNTSSDDPGVLNLAGTTVEDFELVEGSPAIDAGELTDLTTVDILNRAVPDASGVPDVGAFEYGSEAGTPTGGVPATGGAPASGGVPATGGASVTGGASATGGDPATGGLDDTGGAPATGGLTATGAAGAVGGNVGTGGVDAAVTGGAGAVGASPGMGATGNVDDPASSKVASDDDGGCSCAFPASAPDWSMFRLLIVGLIGALFARRRPTVAETGRRQGHR